MRVLCVCMSPNPLIHALGRTDNVVLIYIKYQLPHTKMEDDVADSSRTALYADASGIQCVSASSIQNSIQNGDSRDDAVRIYGDLRTQSGIKLTFVQTHYRYGNTIRAHFRAEYTSKRGPRDDDDENEIEHSPSKNDIREDLMKTEAMGLITKNISKCEFVSFCCKQGKASNIWRPPSNANVMLCHKMYFPGLGYGYRTPPITIFDNNNACMVIELSKNNIDRLCGRLPSIRLDASVVVKELHDDLDKYTLRNLDTATIICDDCAKISKAFYRQQIDLGMRGIRMYMTPFISWPVTPDDKVYVVKKYNAIHRSSDEREIGRLHSEAHLRQIPEKWVVKVQIIRPDPCAVPLKMYWYPSCVGRAIDAFLHLIKPCMRVGAPRPS